MTNQDFSVRRIDGESIDRVEEVLSALRTKLYAKSSGAFDSCSNGLYESAASAPATNDATCKAVRNAVLASLVAASDDACDQHLKSIYGKEATVNVGLGTLASLFSGTAAVAGSTAAKSNYAAAGAFFGAERSLSNEVVYKNQLVPAIHFKIVEKRQEKRNALFGHFAKSSADYPLRAAAADAIQYHYSCSFMEGMQWALREGTTDAGESKVLRLRQTVRTAEADLNTARFAAAARPVAQGASAPSVEADPAVMAATARLKEANATLFKAEFGRDPTATPPPASASGVAGGASGPQR